MARDPFVSPLVTTQGEPPVSLHSRVPLAPGEDIIELYTAVAQTGVPNYIGARIPVKTSLNIPVWRALLANYSNTSIPDFLEFGWPINIHPENYNFPHNVHHSNHRSALDYQADVDLFIDKELRYGAMCGPFRANPFPFPVFPAPLQTVAKRDSDTRRVVVDLSYPSGQSVNDAIPKNTFLGEPISLVYPSVDTMTEMILDKGRGCLLFKTDLRRAYRQLPVDPADYRYLCYCWRDNWYIDTRVCFGLRSASVMCQSTTSAITFIEREKGYSVTNYIDDFGGAEIAPLAPAAFASLQRTINVLGLEEAPEKAIPPSTCMTWLGIEFDTVEMVRRVPSFRLEEISDLVAQWLLKRKATKRELQSLVGKLVFVSACVPPGRLFVSRMLESLRKLRCNHHRCRLSRDFRRDLEWWRRFLHEFNGVSLIASTVYTAPDDIVATDACSSGCGAISNGRYSRRLPVHVYRHRRDLRRLRGQNTKLPKAPRRPRDHGLRGDAHRTRDIDHRRDLRRLRGQASRTKWAAFAEGTWSNLRTILRTYLLFCFFYWISPFPATVDTLETFAEFLARSFKAPASIANYLGGLKTLHVLFGYTVDAFLSTDIALLKRGLQRRLCHTPRQVAPFTPDILLRIYEHLDLMDPFHATMWTLILLSFFTFQRKSNFLPKGKFDPSKQCTIHDFTLYRDSLLVRIRWSKTLQCAERVLSIPVLAIPNSPLCPVAAFRNMLRLNANYSGLAVFTVRYSSRVVPLSQSVFDDAFKRVLVQAGLNPQLYSLHSGRRGGATFAFRSGVPVELIKIQGDWRSQAYLLYPKVPLRKRLELCTKMIRRIRSTRYPPP
ncbi:uncharacterized protein LOC118408444 isoform X2 [Branchiostoma floridae]|uniref:Uncharacterized protein LOC118408444 isoform X2 n=1 Tax=Branchiostoma floridae TaxID=7739 RepID=A0A9J7HST5_BRAFL|nr:uncharacterized protein LOC118408444 isoform X2 [Branchiostoma floridae]